jgi:hypothetical protein
MQTETNKSQIRMPIACDCGPDSHLKVDAFKRQTNLSETAMLEEPSVGSR